jgi:predicted dehydrogenase
MNKVIVIGTGNIGKRHIQALYKSQLDFKILAHDIFKDSLQSVNQFCISNGLDLEKISLIEDFDSLLAHIDSSTIVIIATTATGRKAILESVIEYKPAAIIAEKPVVQTDADYLYIQSIAARNNVPIYVNFIAHAQHFYREIYENVKNSKSYTFYSNMPNWGMSTVGIHQFELFFWLFGIKEYDVAFSEVSSVYEQKRKGFYDLAGTLGLSDKKGNIGVFRNQEADSFASIQIISEDYLYTVHEQQNTLITIGPDKKVIVSPLNVRFVSMYMQEIIDAIFNKEFDRVYLPDIEQSYLAHKVLFDYISSHASAELNIT